MSVISILRYVNGELDSADTATLTVENTNGAIIAGPSIVPPVSEGTYVYDVTAITPGNYTANWTFVVADEPVAVISRAFVIDAPAAVTSGTTLMDIEQGLAGRLGGTYRRVVTTAGSTISRVRSWRLRSTLNLGDYEDLYLLRRGILQDGSRVDGFVETDRTRMIAEYDHINGDLAIDAPYVVPPLTGEVFELHYFEPDFELRPSVLDGLARCYFWDTVNIASTAPYGTVNLSGILPWLTDPRQIFGVQGQLTNSRWPARRIPWSRAYRRGSGIYLDTENTMPGTLALTVLRPVNTLVNEEMSLGGPNDDWDIMPVEKEYAIRAAHVAAWMRHPERLTPIAALGMGIPLSMCAQAFSIRSLAIANFQPEFPEVRFGSYAGDVVLGNAPEPVI